MLANRLVAASLRIPKKFPSLNSKLYPQNLFLKRSLSSTPTSTNSNSSTTTESVSVKAYYIAQRINLTHVHANVYGTQKNSRQEQKSVTFEIDKSANQYVTVFKYGSIVLFNVPEVQHQIHLTNIRKSAVITPISSSGSSSIATSSDVTPLTEDYKIIVNPNLHRPSVVKAEHVNIRSLNSNNIAIISTVMAQSVALDYYAALVERRLEDFLQMTVKVEERGSFHELRMPELYQLVAANNRIFGAVLSKLGIFEGSDAAWDNADYFDTWEDLRQDFEIDSRYKDLEMKLDIVNVNSRFFLEILQNQKSTKLEWIIIILIAAEIIIGLCGLAPVYLSSWFVK